MAYWKDWVVRRKIGKPLAGAALTRKMVFAVVRCGISFQQVEHQVVSEEFWVEVGQGLRYTVLSS